MKTSDPIQRLAAADPLPDAERLTAEEQREADDLLARLVAESANRRRRPRMLRPATAIAAAAACAIALLLAAVETFDDDTSGPDVVAKAVAAVTDDDSIFHVVELVRVSGPDLDHDAIVESWYAPDGSVHQKFFRVGDGDRRGRLEGENAGRLRPQANGRLAGNVDIYNASANLILRTRFGRIPMPQAPRVDPASDPGVRLRQLEAEGALRLAGESRVDGREAYRLVSGRVRGLVAGVLDRYEYFVDAETFYPLSLRVVTDTKEGRFVSMSRYRVYEALPFNVRNRSLLDLDPHPGARIQSGAGREGD